jgi:hypothetical protein
MSIIWCRINQQRKSFPLALAGCLHSFLNDSRRISQAHIAQFFVLNAWNFNVDVNAVQQGTGDAFLVFSDDAR